MAMKGNGKGKGVKDPEIYNRGWDTVEDFERDLILFADIEQPDGKKRRPSTPDTIRKFNETMRNNKRSMYTDTAVDESLTYFISGRGKGVIDRVVRPGEMVTPLPSDDEELRRQIRQVSGLGYSNALIEESIKANYVDQPTSNEVDWSVWESAGTVKANTSRHRRGLGSDPDRPSSSASEPLSVSANALSETLETEAKDLEKLRL